MFGVGVKIYIFIQWYWAPLQMYVRGKSESVRAVVRRLQSPT